MGALGVGEPQGFAAVQVGERGAAGAEGADPGGARRGDGGGAELRVRLDGLLDRGLDLRGEVIRGGVEGSEGGDEAARVEQRGSVGAQLGRGPERGELDVADPQVVLKRRRCAPDSA
jgi:hypothetical protein